MLVDSEPESLRFWSVGIVVVFRSAQAPFDCVSGKRDNKVGLDACFQKTGGKKGKRTLKSRKGREKGGEHAVKGEPLVPSSFVVLKHPQPTREIVAVKTKRTKKDSLFFSNTTHASTSVKPPFDTSPKHSAKENKKSVDKNEDAWFACGTTFLAEKKGGKTSPMCLSQHQIFTIIIIMSLFPCFRSKCRMCK
jgi:hypothetical protein